MAHDANAAHGHDELAHPMPVPMLVGVFVALILFTGLTVFVASLHLGAQLSFTVAMIIATIKAGLVMAIFMHLWWDKRLNLLVFLGCFLFVMLFISMLLADKSEYTPDINRRIADEAAQAGK